MAIHYGNADISKIYFGDSEVNSVWYGSTKVYEGTPAFDPVFSQNSPTSIATAIDNNTIPSTWNVEDYINVTLTNNTIARVMIMHNTASTSNYKFNDDNTTCPLILGVSHIIPPTHQMNTSATNAGGWNASAMRTYLNSSSFLDLFPTEWKNCFAMLKVKAMNGGSQGGTTLVESADKIFLFAEKEYYGGVEYSSSTEGDALNQLDLYRIHGVTTSYYSYLRKGTTPRGTDYAAYWERSPSASNPYFFCQVLSDGSTYTDNARNDRGVVVGFSLSLSHH